MVRSLGARKRLDAEVQQRLHAVVELRQLVHQLHVKRDERVGALCELLVHGFGAATGSLSSVARVVWLTIIAFRNDGLR